MQTNTMSYSGRLGMYKNFRVGVIKYFQKSKSGKDSMLIEVVEPCHGSAGKYYATYNLHVEFDEKYQAEVEHSAVGSWVLFGFYIQSFKTHSYYTTVLRLRHYETIPNTNSVFSVYVSDPRTKEDREIIIPTNAHALMNLITNQTQFNEHGTR